MSNDLLKYAFVAGELSPTLLGRTDLTKYDLAMAEAYNFFVDYRGGLSSRPGTQFVDFLPDYVEGAYGNALGGVEELGPIPFIAPIKIEAETEYNFLAVMTPINNAGATTFSHSILRFVYNGRYTLEPTFAITAATAANPMVVTAPGHNYVVGDWVHLDDVYATCNFTSLVGTTFVVRNVVGNTFNLELVSTGNLVDGTVITIPGGIQARIGRLYTLTCDYRPTDYARLQFESTFVSGRDLAITRITHGSYPIRNLIWDYNGTSTPYYDQSGKAFYILDEVIGVNTVGPTITSATSSAVGVANVVFAVTSVYDGDVESIRGPAYRITNCVNYTATEGSVSINWTADPNARYYNIYRSIVSVSETLVSGLELGFVGRTKSTKFTDPNIIPDFSRTLPRHHDPFAPGRVVAVKVTAGGAGYVDFANTVTITGAGASGFLGEANVNAGGSITNVNVLAEGRDFSFLSSFVITGAGAGATLVAVNSDDLYGQYPYPGLSAVYQSRQLYAASLSSPTTIWGSAVAQFDMFDISPNVVDSDPFDFTLTPSHFNYAPIRHLLATHVGLIAMTQENIWLINGGGPTTPITATNVVALPQNYGGASYLRPLRIGDDILYTEGKGFTVRALAYNEVSRSYGSEDRSILSSHLMGVGKEINAWAYQEQPFKVVWGTRTDGALLAFTIVKTEEIYAWCSGGTAGMFLNVASFRENVGLPVLLPYNIKTADSVYFITQRKIGGRWRRMIERMAQRDFQNLEEAWCLDCAVSTKVDYGDSSLYIELGDNGNWRLYFNDEYPGLSDRVTDIGDIVYAAGGIFRTLDTPTAWWEADALQLPKQVLMETEGKKSIPLGVGQWSSVTPSATVTGLWHMEGEEVSVFADGIPLDNMVVQNGKLTLSAPTARVLVGWGYKAKARTLPLSAQGQIVEGKRKRIPALGVRLERTKGLKAGRTEAELYDVERGGEATVMKNGIHYELLSTSWEDDSSITFVQDKPLPVTMLSLISEVEVGDDSD